MPQRDEMWAAMGMSRMPEIVGEPGSVTGQIKGRRDMLSYCDTVPREPRNAGR